MAETIGIEVFLGMDAKQLQAELQKSENQLRQFQNQLKKSTDTTEIAKLQTSIGNLKGTINNISTAMGNTAKKSGDATQSLINLSRVAQDAPYGFIGIANNINPLLESFQRLKTETGSTGTAIKSLVSGIAGPAGLGLAVGVASSLLVVYSKEIADFFKSPTDKLKEFRKELNKISSDIYKVIGEAQTNRTIGLNLVNLISGGNPTQQAEALKRLKALYSENKAIQDAKVGNDKQYYINLVNIAAKQEEAASKEQNVNEILNKAYEERKKIEKQRDTDLKNVKQEFGAGGVPIYNIEAVKKRIRDNAKVQLDEIDKTIVQAKMKQLEFLTTLSSIETPDKKTGKETDPFTEQLKEDNKKLAIEMFRRKQMIDKLKETYGTGNILTVGSQENKRDSSNRIKNTEKGLESTEKGLGKYLMDNAKKFTTLANAQEDAEKSIASYKEKSIELADTLSNYTANAFMNLYSAMQQGMSIGEALKNVFVGIAEQIAFAAVKAAAFTAILNLIPGMQGVSTALGGFKGIFTKLLGLADGGIVTGPTLAMVGEGAESEAVMPLSKLGNLMNNTFNAGAMASNGGGGNGEFILRGTDLVLAMNRSESSLKYRRG
jgi:predicted  nucleic acid-binding Zn-ribbon protein